MNNKELFQEYKKTGDIKIKNQILLKNGGFVKDIVMKKFNYPHIIEDLMQEGLIAFSNCIESYNPDKGALTTFSYYAIRNRLLNYLRKNQQTYTLNTETLSDFIPSPPAALTYSIIDEALQKVKPSTKKHFLNYVANFPVVSQVERVGAGAVKDLIKKDIK